MRAASGQIPARPHVNRIHDEARELGLKVAVCSAATKSSALVVLENLMGQERFKVRRAVELAMASERSIRRSDTAPIPLAAAATSRL